MSFKCLHCSSASAEQVYSSCQDYYLGKTYRPSYFRCTQCGLTQQSPLPADVSGFYDAYPIHQAKSPVHAIMRKLIMSAVYFHDTDLPPGASVVDYGCGDGWFLESLKQRGFKTVGFELDSGQASRLSERLGIPVYSRQDELLKDWAGKADVVTMHFVLEHVTNLHQTFETVRQLLRPGGRFYFVVPNVNSVESRWFKEKWHNLDPPRHISFPEDRQVRELATQHGFEWRARRWRPFPNGIAGSIPVILTGKFRFLLFLLALPIGILLSRLWPDGTAAYWLERRA